MHYRDSRDRSAELLRLAIARMAEHPAGLHPQTYAVWYEYLAGRNHTLKAEIDAAVGNGVPLSDELIGLLYRRHLVDGAERATMKVSQDLREMIDEVGSTTADAGARVSDLQAALSEQTGQLPQLEDAAAIGSTIERLLENTRSTNDSLSVLAARLTAATTELEQLRTELDQAREQATRDALTGVVNRRGFDEALERLAVDPGGGASLMLIDLDHFKQINDRYGHLFGDRVLKAVAQAIVSCVKGRDVVARFGGEEFAVLLPGTPLPGALALAEQVRTTVAASRIRRGSQGESIGAITVSLGVAALQVGELPQALVERADAALYRSKGEGRNRVTAG